MLSSRLTANLRHLCSLGLPGEVLVPQFFDAMDEVVPSDSTHFFWLDRQGLPRNYWGNVPGVEESLVAFLENIERLELARFGDTALSLPHILAGKDVVLLGQGEDKQRYRASVFYNDIIRVHGGRYGIVTPIRDATMLHAGVSLWRESEGAEFSAHDKASLQRLMPYLSYALNAEVEADGCLVEDENRGIVLLERSGRIVQMDARAERLLFLAAHPQLDASLRKYAKDFARPVQEMCRNLVRMFEGEPSPPPQMFHRNRWGTFGFRAHWLRPPGGDAGGMVAAVVSLHVPRRLKFWQGIYRLGLPPRQQEVCLLFAEGRSLAEIAQRLNLSRHTVITHVRKIYERLDIAPDRETLVERLLRLKG